MCGRVRARVCVYVLWQCCLGFCLFAVVPALQQLTYVIRDISVNRFVLSFDVVEREDKNHGPENPISQFSIAEEPARLER